MSNTIIYVFAIIVVLLVVGLMYYFNKDKKNPYVFSSTESQETYVNMFKPSKPSLGGKRKRNKPRRRR
jgi:hypothetical protein